MLCPALVDFRSGFRYYTREQMATARRIHLLRSLDLPLDDIWAFLGASDPETMRLPLERHRRRIAARIAGDQRALAVLHALDAQCQQPRKEWEMSQDSKPYQYSYCGKDNADCGKDNAEVRRMIAAPNGVFICNECVAKCNEIIAKEEAKVSSA